MTFSRRRRNVLEEAVRAMPKKSCRILQLCCHESLSCAEAAKLTGVPEDEVRRCIAQTLLDIKHVVDKNRP